MNPSRIFIERPVATSLLMIALLLLGAVAYRSLPVSALPSVDYPTIQVTTLYPGASPEVMASSVTGPLERQFGQMPGLKQMTSKSSGGASVIVLQFDLTLALDIAEQEAQAAINAATSLLPTDLPAPPIYAKVNPADTPIMTLALTSATLKLTEVQSLADTQLAQKISQLPGVGLVSLGGGNRRAVRIRFNPTALAGYGLNIDDLRTSISNANVNTPKGTLDGASQSWTINANDQLQTPQGYLDTIIAYRNGRPVRLSDVATVVDGPENTGIGAWVDQDQGIILNVQRQPGANVIAVAQSIKDLLPTLQAGLPASVHATHRERPHRDHPRLGRRRRVRARAGRRARRGRHLRVPARLARDRYSGPLRPALDRRHAGGNVSVGVQPRQSVADGAHHRHRFRGRRRDRRHREHLPLRRSRRDPDGKPP